VEAAIEALKARAALDPLLAQVDDLVAEVGRLWLPRCADARPLGDRVETAVRTADAAAVERLAACVDRAPTVEWRASDLVEPSPEAFEGLVADVWRAAPSTGDVALTRYSSDGGIDVVVRFTDGHTELIQVKQSAVGGTVGRPVIQQTEGAGSQFDADTAAVVTNTSFTEPARRAAASIDGMRLVDGETLVSLLAESALVPPRALRPDT